jgi:hypothetical protein
MDKDKREGWLRALKVGDKVIVNTGGHYGKKYVKYVSKITPTGRIIVDATQYNERGWERTSNHFKHSKFLIEYTKEDEEEIIIKQIIFKLENTNWHTVPPDKLKKIHDILEG